MQDTLKEQLKALFGKPQRVVMAAWILERRGSAFFLAEIQDGLRELGVSPSGVGSELDTFLQYGMLSQFRDGRRNYYVSIDHALWAAWAAIGEGTGLTPLASHRPDNPSPRRADAL